MILWLRVRRAWVLPLALVVIAGLLVFLGDDQMVVPTVIGGGIGAILWTTLLPMGWAAALGYTFESKGADVEARPGNRLAVLDTATFVGSTLVAAGVFAVLATSTSSPVSLVAHLLIVSGIGIGATVLFGASVGMLIVTAVLLLTSSFSPHLGGAQYVRILQPDGNTGWSLILGVALIVATVVIMLYARRTVVDVDE